jgi:hypothetical protein
MVTVKLMGGLGNQMFQYAIGRSLAHDSGEKLILDTSFYDRGPSSDTTPRHYELYHLNVHGDVIRRGSISRNLMVIFEKVVKKFPLLCPKYTVEKKLTYDPSLMQKRNNIYLDGYWQCEKYFLHNADIIHRDFQVITPQSDENKMWAELILNTTSVCLHVRRGDYVTNADANLMHGLRGPDYYNKAIEYISGKVDTPVFFVFSDDMEWAQDNISIPYEVHYMDQNGPKEDYEDIRLMMQCKHFIIANSSFSWWGAWLGVGEDKIVVCPKNWFNDSEMKTDIICDSWVML